MMGWWLALAWAEPAVERCVRVEAQAAYQQGYAALQKRHTETAGAALARCLEFEPSCTSCRYELGWNHWARGEFAQAATVWEVILGAHPSHAASQWIDAARTRAAGGDADEVRALRVPIGQRSVPEEGEVQLTLVARFQNYDAAPTHPADHHDTDIYSPKSARFSADGEKVYVNSLEGYKTVVYDPATFAKSGVIKHVFTEAERPLFQGETTVFEYAYNRRSHTGDPNQFSGKPVESALSHEGRYLWVPYYRRDFDVGATSPSAVAVIDTRTDAVVRVMPTGPIPKYVAIAPDGKTAAIAHWGDNTVALLDISASEVDGFQYRADRLVVERVLPQAGLAGQNRDGACGHCLRGTVFTPDSKVLLVARMGTGGVAGFDVESGRYLGTVTGERPTPRHLIVDPTGEWLYFTSNRSGYVSRIRLATVRQGLNDAEGKTVHLKGYEEVRVGSGARTLVMAPDGRHLFVAVNGRMEIVAVDASTMGVVARVRTDAYPVGLAISPDGSQVWVTAQGRSGKGGNSVSVYRVSETASTPAPG